MPVNIEVSGNKVKAKVYTVDEVGYVPGEGTPIVGKSGTLTVKMDAPIKRLAPTGACTLIASGGRLGQECTFSITTVGVTSFVITWGTGFKTMGTLATGTVANKTFSVCFIHNGTAWVETGRTTAM